MGSGIHKTNSKFNKCTYKPTYIRDRTGAGERLDGVFREDINRICTTLQHCRKKVLNVTDRMEGREGGRNGEDVLDIVL